MLKNILIIAALPEEELAIHSELSGTVSTEVLVSSNFAIRSRQYKIRSSSISIIQSGMGGVNAALACALFSEQYQMDAILLLGVGGALSTQLRIGDLVVSKYVLQHDYLSSLDIGTIRMKPGALILNSEDQKGHEPRFRADASLVAIANSDSSYLGTIASGNEFVGTSLRKQQIADMDNEALLVDMEAAGVAQVAERLQTPFVVVKTVADRLFPDGTIENDFRTCLNAASKNAAKIMTNFISHL